MRWIWIDRFASFKSGQSAQAVKNLSLAEDHFRDHFPGYPVMPAALILEGLAQTGGILVGEVNSFQEKVVLAKVPRAVFHREMLAGEQLIYEAEILHFRPEGASVQGRVLVGGYDVRDLVPSWLRARFATVMQEPALFSRSIADNIRFGAEGVSDEEVRRAAALASADEFIERLPAGYATEVGDRGVQLSGGQRQRVAIARAVLRQPQILVLDEATSALDVELESVVQEALRALGYRPTTIIIAHRLSTVAIVDRVIVLQGGRIVESGTHESLLRDSTFYRQLVLTQLVTQ